MNLKPLSLPLSHMLHIYYTDSSENIHNEMIFLRIQMAGEVTLTSQDGQEISKFR